MTEDVDIAEQFAELKRSWWESSTEAAKAAAELAERLSAELFASQGDDAYERARLAHVRYQRDLAEIAFGYWRDAAEHGTRATAMLDRAHGDALGAAYTAYVEMIDQFGESPPTPPAEPAPPGQSKRRTPSRSKSSAK